MSAQFISLNRNVRKLPKKKKNPIFSCFSKTDHRIFTIAIYLHRNRRDLSNSIYIYMYSYSSESFLELSSTTNLVNTLSKIQNVVGVSHDPYE